ncbi:EAL domain-containing protein [[Empedobacter] haloabium]|uniref:EAL domain-containing protein n=1 Tax=[Empedobacter] haloabium TaxID=592317 RepID=A0ABZ1UIE4_9BURK
MDQSEKFPTPAQLAAPAALPAQEALGWITRLVAALELMPGVAVCSIDRAGVVRFCNQACARLCGVTPQQAVGRRLDELLSRGEREAEHAALLEAVWQTGRHGPAGDWIVRAADGREHWVCSTKLPIFQGELGQVFCMDVDITARKHAERTLTLAAQVFENSRDAILLTDSQRRIISVNRAYGGITGFDACEVLGRPLTVSRAGVEDETFLREVWNQIEVLDHWQGETCSRRRDGEVFPAWLSLTAIRDGQGQVSNYMAILSDITERKRSEEHTRHLAEHDFLTDLPNRVLLLDRLSLALSAARRKGSMLAILFLDLDRFKPVNDTLGHQVGDALLREVAARLLKCVRKVDTVSRQGGDEFVVILADIGGIDHAAHVAEAVRQAIGQPYRIGEHELHISASIGVSIFPSDGDDIDTLIQNADVAMYHAKEGGRDGFRFFSAAMNQRIVERATFENGLRRALDEQQFELVFEPELDVRSGVLVGAEALVRWRHPELGLLAPERFLDVAEEAGLMVPIGNWVMREACRHARAWHDEGHQVGVAVNLSPAQFQQRDLLEQVQAALDEAGLEARFLELELTEAILMQGGAGVADTLRGLRQLGVRLSLDDFGTGWSRLGQLKDYPIDKLKIAQAFLAGGFDPTVIRTIIAMARSMDMTVIAEGVETAEQLEFLRGQGCDQYQGYHAVAAARASGQASVLH